MDEDEYSEPASVYQLDGVFLLRYDNKLVLHFMALL
jgi:hypothetical protein